MLAKLKPLIPCFLVTVGTLLLIKYVLPDSLKSKIV